MWALLLSVALCSGHGALGGPRAEAPALHVWAPAVYVAESAVQLNEAQRKDKALGYEVRGSLRVEPLWHQGPEWLVRLRVMGPRLFLRGAHVLADHVPYESLWDRYPDTSCYVQWREGRVLRLYLDPQEPLDLLNYKKSLASLFQVGALDGTYNETDAGGACSVLYETLSSTELRKVKRSCRGDVNVVEARRAVRYTLDQGLTQLSHVFADELLVLGAPRLGLKARSWVRLRRTDERVPEPRTFSDLQAALGSLPAGLVPHALELDLPPDLHRYHEEPLQHQELATMLLELSAALDEAGGAQGQEAGVERAALLVGRVVRAVRATDAAHLGALAARPDLTPHLSTLCRALGLAGTLAAHEAASRLLQLEGAEPLRALALDYLGALAVSAAPDEAAVRAALRLGETARDRRVGEAALLAAGGAAPRSSGGAALSEEVRHSVVRALSRCQDAACVSSMVSAAGNTRSVRADSVEVLLQAAERGGLPALDALHAVPLSFSHLERLDALALNGSASLEVRAAALDLLVVRRADMPAPLARTAHVLYAAGPDPSAHELRRVLWQRVAALAPHSAELRRLPLLLSPELRTWDALAHAGTSHVLSRSLGWSLCGWEAHLDSVQVARGGVLRRGAVTLRAHHQDGSVRDVLGVRLWARGLHALAGDQDEAAPVEEAAAGLALDVAGVRLPELTLFTGQAELLGHVWAGTASTPTPALRALVPMRDRVGAVRLAGGAALAVLVDGAAALALDAQAQASLWYRSAHTRLELRAGAALEVRAALRVAWGEVAARAAVSSSPRLHIDADLDFYSGVALCVRAHSAPHVQRRVVRAHSVAGARRLRVSRVVRAASRREGGTLSLGRPNDQVCRTLRAQHDD